MKVRNKRTGEIVENAYIRESHDFYNKRTIAVFIRDGNRPPERVSTGYETLAELNAEWEDYKEPVKPYWFVNDLDGEPMKCDLKNCGKSNFIEWGKHRKEIGNYFETEEEAKKAVERLRAWKRLKDKGAEFYGWRRNQTGTYELYMRWYDRIPRSYEVKKDLNLLFGGEE